MPVIEQEFNSAGNLTMTRMNVLGARGIEAVINVPVSGSATMNWLMVDGHGNVVRTMNTNFGLSAYQWRGVWGERQTGTLQTRKGYVANLGHQEDETGLIYMRARYYEPTTGRFISEDPARDGVNWYLYADANPVNRVDASGRESEWAAYGGFFAFCASIFAVYGVKTAVAGRAAEAIAWAFRADLFAVMSIYCYFRSLGGSEQEARIAFATTGTVFTGIANRWVGKVLDDIMRNAKLGNAHGLNSMATVAIGASIGYSLAVIGACLLLEI